MPKIIDPTDLVRNTSVIFDITSPAARTIEVSSSLRNPSSLVPPLTSGSDSGVTLQALYSFCKEQWKTQDDLIRVPFPFISITRNQFDLVNNWNFKNYETQTMVRDAGWSVQTGSANNVPLEEWAGIVTLGSLGSTDQVYFQQSQSTEPAVNFDMKGPVNQAIKLYQSGNIGDTLVNKKGHTQLFVRVWNKLYAVASIQRDLAVSTEEYVVYSLPLTNATDLKITEPVSASVTGSPYNEVTLTYYSGSGFDGWASGVTYVSGSVVSGSNSRWYITTSGGLSAGTAGDLSGNPSSDTTVSWHTFSAEREIGSGSWYPFTKIVDGGAGQNNSIAEIYTRVQYLLTTGSDIDNGNAVPPVTGNIADSLLSFLGDTLVTADGVFVDNFQDADTNNIDFYDVSGTVRRFPYVAAGALLPNDNLVNDAQATYYMFFTSVPSGAFGSGSATLVKDNVGAVISGTISGQTNISFTFDYDNNVQGGRTAATNAPVTIVAIGLGTAQYVVTTATIARTKANNFSLVSSLERNYSNPA